MKGELRDLVFGREGEQIITLSTKGDFRPQFDELKDTPIDFTIKKFREKRSLNANAYAWVLIDKIAGKLGLSKADVYREAIRNIGGVSDVVCIKEEAAEKLIAGWTKQGLGWQAEKMTSKIDGCVNVILFYGSSMYDSKQMANLIDLLIMEAKELGIETLTPQELDRLKGGWE